MALADYELVERIAVTNMSEVWEARYLSTGRRVALKRRVDGERAERRFAREIAAQTAAAGHHTMPILDFDESLNWYAMPWADRTLADSSVPDTALALQVLDALAESLRPIHASGQVHRDLKPENILWLDDADGGRWVVADFGIVRNAPGETTATLTIAGGALGSLGWMAPEQHGDAHGSTPATDVYAAGAVMSWTITGVRPRPGFVELPGAATGLRHIVWKATRDPIGDRYPDIGELRAAVALATQTTPEKLNDLIADRNYGGIVNFAVDDTNLLSDLVEELPLLTSNDLSVWYEADPGGAVAVVETTLRRLRDEGVDGLSFSRVDRLLSWAIQLVGLDLPNDAARAEQLATALFKAIAHIHQFAPAKDVLDWLDRRSREEQQILESALRMADAWDFFSAQASGRFVVQRTTPLVRKLAGGSRS